MTQTVLILGSSGKIGRHFAREFEAKGWRVRLYDRARGDMMRQAMGADVIVNGLNPPNYDRWEVQIPKITAQVLEAAKASGATVILPGNVYVFGDRAGLWDENTPHATHTQKGRVRIKMERTYAESGVRTILLRAGDFIDPERGGTLFGLTMVNRVHRGVVTRLGAADVRHTYAYLPDLARAGVALAERRGELARFEDVPFAGHVFTPRELKAALEDGLGRRLRMGVFPWWLFGMARPFWRLAREMWEMRYLLELDHRMDGTKLARLLPEFTATPLETVVLAELPDAALVSARTRGRSGGRSGGQSDGHSGGRSGKASPAV